MFVPLADAAEIELDHLLGSQGGSNPLLIAESAQRSRHIVSVIDKPPRSVGFDSRSIEFVTTDRVIDRQREIGRV